MSKTERVNKASTLNEALCAKLTNARGVVTTAQSHTGNDEMLGFALQAVLDLLQESDNLASELAVLAGASNA